MPREREGDQLRGQQYDPRDRFTAAYTQQEMDRPQAEALIGQENTEITPTDRQNSQVKVYDPSSVAEVLDALYFKSPGVTSFALPDELISVEVIYSENAGGGEKISDEGSVSSVGDHGSLNIDAVASANASAAIIPELSIIIRQRWAQNQPSINVTFYLPQDDFTQADVITKLDALGISGVQGWPMFEPVEHAIVLKGAQTSVQVSADSHHNDTWDDAGNISYSFKPNAPGRSDGYSTEVGVSVRVQKIPPTIHGNITIANASRSISASVEVAANISAITGTGAAPSFDAIVNEPDSREAVAEASVSPTSLGSTTPSAIPTSGLYIKDVQTQPYVFNYNKVFVELVDFSIFA